MAEDRRWETTFLIAQDRFYRDAQDRFYRDAQDRFYRDAQRVPL